MRKFRVWVGLLALATLTTTISPALLVFADRGELKHKSPDIVIAKKDSSKTDKGKTSVEVNVDVKLNSNVVVLDLARFVISGFPYEMDMAKEHLRKMPEYKYGDIIEFAEKPYTAKGRSYLEFEEPLMRDGIVRQPSNLKYSVDDNYFYWTKEHKFKYGEMDTVNKSYFLASMAREAGLIDDVYITTRSKASAIPDDEFMLTRKTGRQKIEESPYQKEVAGQVDIGQNIVLVDYDDGEYLVMKLDNIYVPYIKKLIDMGVVKEDDLIKKDLGDGTKVPYPDLSIMMAGQNDVKDLMRVNYKSIVHSKYEHVEGSNKDWNWQNKYVTVKDSPGKDGRKAQTVLNPSYFRSMDKLYSEENPPFAEYTLDTRPKGSSGDYEEYNLKAQIPEFFENEELTVMQGLEHLYKYVWYKETEQTINQLEVDTIMSLYGLKMSNYTNDEKEVLKYLIVKGLVDPFEDDLERLRRPMLYEDMLKFLFRLNYPEKRFDFKKLSLTAEDVRMVRLGYVQDTFTVRDLPDEQLEKSKQEGITRAVAMESKLGYDEIYLEIPTEQYESGNYSLSSAEDMNATFPIAPIMGKVIYGRAEIPRAFTKDIVLRSNALEGGYRISLEDWEDGGVYRIDHKTDKYQLKETKSDGTVAKTYQQSRFLMGEPMSMTIDSSKKNMYGDTEIFVDKKVDGKNTRVINPKLTEDFGYKDGMLIIKKATTETEFDSITSDIIAPPGLSDDVTYMGYSQLTMDGKKISMIRDVEMQKMGIEILEDNVLFNRNLNTYAFLDPITYTLYYGNTVVRYKPGTLMLTQLEGKNSAFYNYDIVKTMLRQVSNDSIAHQITNTLPADKEIFIADKNGDLYDTVFMHKETLDSGNKEDWWINSATLGRKNSNIIFFRDDFEDVNLLINYRTTHRKSGAGKKAKTDNSFDSLISRLKTSNLEPHEGMNPVLQSILRYDGGFTNTEYNYGMDVIYKNPSENAPKEMKDKVRSEKLGLALNSILRSFKTANDRDKFVASIGNYETYRGIRIPYKWVEHLTELKSDNKDKEGLKEISFGDYKEAIDKRKGVVEEETKGSIYLSYQDVVINQIVNRWDVRAFDLPAKVINNNLYIRYKDFNSFKDLEGNKKYIFLDKLVYLYQFDKKNSTLKIKQEKVNYENTPTGFIPLEAWDPEYPIGKNAYEKKYSIKFSLKSKKNQKNSPYMFDSVIPIKGEPVKIDWTGEKTTRGSGGIDEVYKAMKDSNKDYKQAMENSIWDNIFKYDKKSLRVYLENSLENTRFLGVSGPTNKVLTAKNVKEEGFKLTKGKTYKFSPRYLYPSGTALVKVGEDQVKGLSKKGNNYSLDTTLPHLRPRVVIGNSYDIVNQSVAQLFDTVKAGDIPYKATLVLPSGVELVSLGDNEFLLSKHKPLETIENESVLLWNYLAELNVQVGTSLNFLNGVESIRLPDYNDFGKNHKGLFKELSTKKNWGIFKQQLPIAFSNGGVIQTGTFNKGDDSLKPDNNDKDGGLKQDALVIPIIKLDPNIACTQMYQSEEDGKVYLTKDINTSIDQGFVDYLRGRIVKLNNPDLENDMIDLSSLSSESSEVNKFRMKNLLTLISRVLYIIRDSLPIILFGYGITSMCFLTLYAVPATRNFMETLIPEHIGIVILRVFTLFSIDDLMDMDIRQGLVKSMVVMTFAIFWWSVQKGYLF